MFNARKFAAAAALGLALVGAVSAVSASASDAHHRTTERLVVRGDDVVQDGPCANGVCELELADGTFRGTPVGTGAYSGTIDLAVANAFANGEGGVCAPIDGVITLGAGTPNRLVLHVYGDSCQDGAGDVTTSSFTGVAQFVVEHGTGTYAKARGRGVATFLEDASDREKMTLIGTITR
jgi:hypothetical protein